MEYLKLLGRMELLSHPVYDALDAEHNRLDKLEIADGVIIYPEKVELYIHNYSLFAKRAEIATLQEIIDLYENYDEAVYQRFSELYKWVCTGNGTDWARDYNTALAKASGLYLKKFGKEFIDKETFSQWTTKEKIEFENFIRQNPDFMPREQYDKELNNLGIKVDE